MQHAWSEVTNDESFAGSSSKVTRTIGVYWRFENLPRSWLTNQFWQCPRFASSITSSSRKPSRESRLQRNTREDLSIPGNVFDRQHAQRDSDELHNDSRNLAASSQRAQQAFFSGKFSSEKIMFDWLRPGDSELGPKKCIDRVATRAWISKMTITGIQAMDRSTQAWENTLV